MPGMLRSTIQATMNRADVALSAWFLGLRVDGVGV